MRPYSDGYTLACALFNFFFYFTPLFPLGISSVWDTMLFTSFISLSNLTHLTRFLLLPERAYFYLLGRCMAYLSEYSLINLRSSVECLGPFTKHVFHCLDDRLYVLHNFTLAYQRGPSQGWLARWIILPYISCHEWHGFHLACWCFTRYSYSVGL